jgi:hypothetical protein
MHPPNADITWEQFVEAFRSHHIPEGLMDRMKEKFCNLVHGNKDVMGYSIEFAHLTCYTGEEVSTGANKQQRFCNGLKPALKYALNHVKATTFDDLVNIAVKEETGRLSFEESRKHTCEVGVSSAQALTKKHRLWVPNPAPPRQATMPIQVGYAPRPPA